MFTLAIKWDWCDKNPCRGVERNPESKRKRYLSDPELQRLTKALAETPDRQFANIILLLILTGVRRGEVLSMKWNDLALSKDKKGIWTGIWTKLGSTTKQKSDHVVPLSAPVCQLLAKIKRRGEYVFPSDGATGHVVEIKKGWAGLCKRAGIEGLRIHDLRHSFASLLVLIGALIGT